MTSFQEYLGEKGYIHRDLAARNVLVGKNKIANTLQFGTQNLLSRITFFWATFYGGKSLNCRKYV